MILRLHERSTLSRPCNRTPALIRDRGPTRLQAFWQGLATRIKRSADSRHQPVAATFCHQDFSVGGIAFNFLAQPVNVGFQCVGGNACVVTPNIG